MANGEQFRSNNLENDPAASSQSKRAEIMRCFNVAVFRLHRNGRIVKAKAEQCPNPWQLLQVEVQVTLKILRCSPSSPSHQFTCSFILMLLSPPYHTNTKRMLCWSLNWFMKGLLNFQLYQWLQTGYVGRTYHRLLLWKIETMTNQALFPQESVVKHSPVHHREVFEM